MYGEADGSVNFAARRKLRHYAEGRVHRIPRIVVLIPTRNRASLAIAAIDSVLADRPAEVEIVVSDNSTDELEVTQLEVACNARGHVVGRIRPAEPMSMAAHWDWALEKILEDRRVSHVAVLTDRMQFLPGTLSKVVREVHGRPDELFTYNHDGLNDVQSPVELWQLSWTGRTLVVPTVVLMEMAAHCRYNVLEPVLPRLLNSVIPRHALEAVRKRFGSICGNAIAPDYAFAFQFTTTGSELLHLDRPVLLSYAADRSNGLSAMRGRLTRDYADFLASLGPRGVSYAAPLPGVQSAMNVIVHEYCAVRDQVGILPPVDMAGYRSLLSTEASRMDRGPVRDALEAAVETIPLLKAPRPRSPRVNRLSRIVKRLSRIQRAIGSPRLAVDRLRIRRSPKPSWLVTKHPGPTDRDCGSKGSAEATGLVGPRSSDWIDESAGCGRPSRGIMPR